MLDFSKNYFELFGLPVGYVVDRDRLAQRYRELQRVVHPDRYASASGQERRLSLQGAAFINQAFETLKDPLARGAYLLELHGLDPDDRQHPSTATSFLMEQMELREELAQIPGQADPYAALTDLRRRIDAELRRRIDAMAAHFETVDRQQLQAAQETLSELRFLQKLRTEVETLEARLEDEIL